jgi:hypothetical protein
MNMAAFSKNITTYDEGVRPSAISERGDALKVEIGPLKLGGDRIFGSPEGLGMNGINPDDGQPNPQSISWHRANVVPEKPVVGDKPMTQCTIPNGLWYLTIKFNTLTHPILQQVESMDAGPYLVKTFFKKCCMFLIDLRVDQGYGAKDPKQQVTMQLMEAHDRP